MSGKRVLLLSLVLLGLVVIAGCPQTGEGQRPISTPSTAQEQQLTPAEDLKIMARTVPVMVLKRGAL